MVIVSDTHDALVSFLTDVGDRGVETAIICSVLKFTDDTIVFRIVKTAADTVRFTLQNDLTKLVKWSENGSCYSFWGKVNAST